MKTTKNAKPMTEKAVKRIEKAPVKDGGGVDKAAFIRRAKKAANKNQIKKTK